ncbi:MAG: RNA polymerase sigma factor [Acidobacteriota bacterium]|nr:RNA polymerase sigma factor [Acidobacteriota bacterium]
MSEQPAAGTLPTEGANRLSALFDAHAERLYRLARRLTPSADDALDLVQEVFLRAARSPELVPVGTKEEAWLVRVLVNVRRDQWRKEAVRKRHDLAPSHVPVGQDDPESAFVIRTTVWRALESLAPCWWTAVSSWRRSSGLRLVTPP